MNSGIISKEEQLKQVKSNGDLNNIKNIFILKRILSYIIKIKTFVIIRYNKNLQKRLNYDINDYKKYFQFYSQIEIELKCYSSDCRCIWL